MKSSYPIYGVIWNDDNRLGVAKSIDKLPIFILPPQGLVPDWKTLYFDFYDGIYGDYISSDAGLRLCSKQLRDILQTEASPDDKLQWLEVVLRKGSEEQTFYALHFSERHPILDTEHTEYVPKSNSVIKPAFSKKLCHNFNIFDYPRKYSGTEFFIRDHVKKAIEAAKCTGMEFWGRPEY
jgi:hypothetical protein